MTTVLAIHQTYDFFGHSASNRPFMRDPEKVRVVDGGAGYRDCSCLAMAGRVGVGGVFDSGRLIPCGPS
jgi:hypothetical protein